MINHFNHFFFYSSLKYFSNYDGVSLRNEKWRFDRLNKDTAVVRRYGLRDPKTNQFFVIDTVSDATGHRVKQRLISDETEIQKIIESSVDEPITIVQLKKSNPRIEGRYNTNGNDRGVDNEESVTKKGEKQNFLSGVTVGLTVGFPDSTTTQRQGLVSGFLNRIQAIGQPPTTEVTTTTTTRSPSIFGVSLPSFGQTTTTQKPISDELTVRPTFLSNLAALNPFNPTTTSIEATRSTVTDNRPQFIQNLFGGNRNTPTVQSTVDTTTTRQSFLQNLFGTNNVQNDAIVPVTEATTQRVPFLQNLFGFGQNQQQSDPTTTDRPNTQDEPPPSSTKPPGFFSNFPRLPQLFNQNRETTQSPSTTARTTTTTTKAPQFQLNLPQLFNQNNAPIQSPTTTTTTTTTTTARPPFFQVNLPQFNIFNRNRPETTTVTTISSAAEVTSTETQTRPPLFNFNLPQFNFPGFNNQQKQQTPPPLQPVTTPPPPQPTTQTTITETTTSRLPFIQINLPQFNNPFTNRDKPSTTPTSERKPFFHLPTLSSIFGQKSSTTPRPVQHAIPEETPHRPLGGTTINLNRPVPVPFENVLEDEYISQVLSDEVITSLPADETTSSNPSTISASPFGNIPGFGLFSNSGNNAPTVIGISSPSPGNIIINHTPYYNGTGSVFGPIVQYPGASFSSLIDSNYYNSNSSKSDSHYTEPTTSSSNTTESTNSTSSSTESTTESTSTEVPPAENPLISGSFTVSGPLLSAFNPPEQGNKIHIHPQQPLGFKYTLHNRVEDAPQDAPKNFDVEPERVALGTPENDSGGISDVDVEILGQTTVPPTVFAVDNRQSISVQILKNGDGIPTTTLTFIPTGVPFPQLPQVFLDNIPKGRLDIPLMEILPPFNTPEGETELKEIPGNAFKLRSMNLVKTGKNLFSVPKTPPKLVIPTLSTEILPPLENIRPLSNPKIESLEPQQPQNTAIPTLSTDILPPFDKTVPISRPPTITTLNSKNPLLPPSHSAIPESILRDKNKFNQNPFNILSSLPTLSTEILPPFEINSIPLIAPPLLPPIQMFDLKGELERMQQFIKDNRMGSFKP